MKPLTPFEKKLARWYVAYPKWHLATFFLAILSIPILILLILFLLASSFSITDNPKIDGLVFAFLFLIIMVVLIILLDEYVIHLELNHLPEIASKEAQKAMASYPELNQQIENLIEIAIKQDDGTYLLVYLNKIKKWEELKKSLDDFQQAEKNIIEKIAALEKEMRMKEE